MSDIIEDIPQAQRPAKLKVTPMQCQLQRDNIGFLANAQKLDADGNELEGASRDGTRDFSVPFDATNPKHMALRQAVMAVWREEYRAHKQKVNE